jgi:hypothetical protein
MTGLLISSKRLIYALSWKWHPHVGDVISTLTLFLTTSQLLQIIGCQSRSCVGDILWHDICKPSAKLYVGNRCHDLGVMVHTGHVDNTSPYNVLTCSRHGRVAQHFSKIWGCWHNRTQTSPTKKMHCCRLWAASCKLQDWAVVAHASWKLWLHCI